MVYIFVGGRRCGVYQHPGKEHTRKQNAVMIGLRTPRPATEPRNGQTRNFHEKYRKNTPPGRNSGTPRKYRKNTKKNTKNAYFWYFGGIFSVFSGYFGDKFWESRISGRGVFFRYFSWKFRVWPFRGSVAGRGVPNSDRRLKRHAHHEDYLPANPYHSPVLKSESPLSQGALKGTELR